MAVFDLFLAVHALDIGGYKFQWARPVERYHRNNVIDILRLHLHHITRHTVAFQLEDARGVALIDELERFCVLDGDIFQGQIGPMSFFNQLARARHNGQGAQAQEIDLEQPQRANDRHFELCNGLDGAVFGPGGRAVERHVVHHRLIRDHHPRRVGARIADRAFHLSGGVDQILQVIGLVVQLLQLRHLLQCFRDRNRFARDAWDQLCHPVDLCQRNIHYPAYVPDSGFCSQRSKGDDLGHFIIPVLLGAVLQYFRAFIILEVQVDIRHFNAPRVEEALEDQPIAHRLHQGDIQRIRHHRTGRRSARVIPDALFASRSGTDPKR